MKASTATVAAIAVILLVALGGFVIYPRLTGSGGSGLTGSNTDVSSTSYVNGKMFAFQPPILSGGDKAVSLADFAPHSGDTNEWLEAKIVPYNTSGSIWAIHANFVGATYTTSGDTVTVTTHGDSATYPNGVATYNAQSSLMTFNVTSIPTGGSWYKNARVGDSIECYPFSTEAFWASGSNFYWSGNCRVIRGNQTLSGVGHFIRTWEGGGGINGARLPGCYPLTNFEGVFSVVSTMGTIQIVDLLCGGVPRYQVGGVLWFDNGGWENVGSTEGKPATSETPQDVPGCTTFLLTVPTSRGTLTANVILNRYSGGGCTNEDGSLSGSVTFNGASYPILGVMAEFRCASGYC